jgi:signal transduction histidine kinase
MEMRLPAHFFFFPADEKPLIVNRFEEIAFTRLRYLLPVLSVVGLFLLGADLIRPVEGASSAPYRWFTMFDAPFLFVHLVSLVIFAAVFRLRGNRARRVSARVLFPYAAFVLTWAALVAAVELQQTGNVTTIIIAIMAAAMLTLFSIVPFCVLILWSILVFVLFALLVPGPVPLSFERVAFLFALALVSVAVSRSLFSAFVQNILANRRLQGMQISLIQQEKFATIGQLSAGIAHEINNPLGFVKSNLSTLEQGFRHIAQRSTHLGDDPSFAFLLSNMEKMFQDMREGFRRISEIIDNLRSFSFSPPADYFGPYNINEGIENTLVVARNSCRQIARIARDPCPVPDIQARGSEINQVILNIILNALNAISTSGAREEGTITISTGANDTHVHCRISNSGPAVPPEIRTRIFDPFFTTRPAGQGLGLGLSLSYEIVVKRHHGSLQLEEGLPTTFRISLPIRQALR